MKRLSARKIIFTALYTAIIAFFCLLPTIALMYDNMPKRHFTDSLTAYCEKLYKIKFDGSFTPAEYRKLGFQDPRYLLTLKNIQSPRVILSQYYAQETITVKPLDKDIGRYSWELTGSGNMPAEIYTASQPPLSSTLYIFFYLEEDNSYTAVLTYN